MDANTLLFEQKFDGKSLFKSQLELVQALLNDSETEYYIDMSKADLYNRAQTRLKTYISQLLSITTVRTITEDFKRGLSAVISKKLPDINVAQRIVEEIIEDLKEKNSSIIKSENKYSMVEEFYSDFYNANYIAIITSKPLEIEAEINPAKFSLRKALFTDFIATLEDPNKDFKTYRFNFPIESSSLLFWKGFKKMLTKHLKNNINNASLFQTMYDKFAIKTKTINQIEKNEDFKETNLSAIADEVLTLLNTNRHIMVFTCNSPIYSLPLVAINPAEAKNSRLYALLDGENQETYVYKYPSEEIVLWRLFVWDKLKSKSYEGTNFGYDASLIG